MTTSFTTSSATTTGTTTGPTSSFEELSRLLGTLSRIGGWGYGG